MNNQYAKRLGSWCIRQSRKAVLFVFIVYAIMFCLQRALLFPTYMADKTLGPLQPPAAYHLADFTEIHLAADDGVHLTGWAHAPENGMPVILYFHGNGMHIAGRIGRYRAFTGQGYGVFALSFRGYGTSEGSPSEQGLYKDGRAALAWIRQHYPNVKIIVYGESLGTGTAAQIAAEQPVYGLVLQSAYTSIEDRVADIYWFFPGIHHLVLDRFDTLSKMPAIRCPILIMHGDRDTVIPISNGRLLAKAATSRVQFVEVPGAGHMNIPDSVIIQSMNHFFAINPIKETIHE